MEKTTKKSEVIRDELSDFLTTPKHIIAQVVQHLPSKSVLHKIINTSDKNFGFKFHYANNLKMEAQQI
jgi:hypothetical protein